MDDPPQHARRVSLTIATSTTILCVIAVGATLVLGSAYLLPVATAFVFAVILAPICTVLERIRIPAAISALLAIIVAGAIIYAGFALVARPAARWIDKAPETLAQAQTQISKLRKPLKTVEDLSNQVNNLSIVPNAPKARTVVLEGPGLTQSLIASAQTILVQAAFILILTYFFLLTRQELRQKMIAFQRKQSDRVRTARAFRDVERGVGGYFVIFTLINIAGGVAVWLACWALGLPEPLMWGGLSALLNFIPFLGPALTVGLLALAGLSTFDTLLQDAYPVLAYIAISFVQANIVTPAVMSRRMTLNPLGVMLAVSFWTWIWGPVGALIALPLLIMLKVVADHTPALKPLGVLLGGKLARTKRKAGAAVEVKPAAAPRVGDLAADVG
jgi:predicted PurR-regulated permease PerM